MRGFLSALTVIVAVPLITATGYATHSEGNGPQKDLVNGSGKLPFATPFGTFPGHLHVTGISEPDGTDPRGHFFVDVSDTPFGDVSFDGQVVCLTVVTNAATFRGIITKSNSAQAPIGFGILGRVVDLGEPGSDETPDSAAGFLTSPPPPMPSCPDTPIATTPLEQGNFNVHDAVE